MDIHSQIVERLEYKQEIPVPDNKSHIATVKCEPDDGNAAYSHGPTEIKADAITENVFNCNNNDESRIKVEPGLLKQGKANDIPVDGGFDSHTEIITGDLTNPANEAVSRMLDVGLGHQEMKLKQHQKSKLSSSEKQEVSWSVTEPYMICVKEEMEDETIEEKPIIEGTMNKTPHHQYGHMDRNSQDFVMVDRTCSRPDQLGKEKRKTASNKRNPPLTAAERQRRYRERLRKEQRYTDYRTKSTERSRLRRRLQAIEFDTLPSDVKAEKLKERREAGKARTAKFRERQKMKRDAASWFQNNSFQLEIKRN